MTEAWSNNFVTDPATPGKNPGTAGKPMIYNQVRIVPGDGSDSSAGRVGIRGVHLFGRYWNNPQATAEFLADGWSQIWGCGMQGEFITSSGEKRAMIATEGNACPSEGKQIIAEHPEVEQAVVVGTPDPEWGRRRWPSSIR